jgi:hypothetical protein
MLLHFAISCRTVAFSVAVLLVRIHLLGTLKLKTATLITVKIKITDDNKIPTNVIRHLQALR